MLPWLATFFGVMRMMVLFCEVGLRTVNHRIASSTFNVILIECMTDQGHIEA